jgi:cytochrome c biogenesis protein CcmG, thiol:disulfide interchange protein DsbE
MKNISVLFLLLFAFALNLYAQQTDKNKKIPAADVKTLENLNFNTSELSNNQKPIVISFWATWCKPCITELNAMSELYAEWVEKTGVKIIAVSIDDARNMAKVAPFINGKGWDYDVYLDPNGNFKRAMNVNAIPHTFLVNHDMEIVWQHNSYAPGDEFILYDNIEKLAKGIPLED